MSDLRYNQLEKAAVAIAVKTANLAAMTSGTVYTGFLPSAPILDYNHDGVGGFGNSSFSATGSAFTNEVEKDALVLANGDYFFNYKTGYYKVKAAASVTPAATWYVKVLFLDATGITATIGAVTVADGDNAVEGSIADAAVVTSASGTLSAKLRGIIALLVAKINVKEADGDNVAIGALADAAVVTSASGSLSAKLRGIIALLVAKINVKEADGDNVTLGTTTDAGVITDTTGTAIGFLRGLVKLIAAKINVKIADGEDVTLGITTGAAIVSDVDGTIQRYSRGLVKIFADVWNSTVHALGIQGLGTAGTPAGGVVTVQGVSSGTVLPVILPASFYTHVFATAVDGATQDITTSPKKSFSIQVIAVGGVITAWTVNVQVSLDGTTFTTILSHGTADGDSVTKFTGASMYPARYFKANVTTLTLDTATGATVNILAQ